MTFADKLERGWSASGGSLCVGLDPVLSRIPEELLGGPRPLLAFNKHVVDLVGDLVCAFKPQAAHHGAQAAEADLAETIAYIRRKAPHALVILDAKRGDIGSTAEMYAREAFERYDADAVTVNPYLGDDGITPFLKDPERGAIVLCRTSNEGASLIQEARVNGATLFETIARRAQTVWNDLGNVMLVVGATYIPDLERVRMAAPDVPFLVPGVGEQGGRASDVIRSGRRTDGRGLVVSASRSVLYAGDAAAIRAAAQTLHNELLTR